MIKISKFFRGQFKPTRLLETKEYTNNLIDINLIIIFAAVGMTFTVRVGTATAASTITGFKIAWNQVKLILVIDRDLGLDYSRS